MLYTMKLKRNMYFMHKLFFILSGLKKESREKELNHIGNADEDEDKDIVLLGENTKYPTMKWRFPDTIKCPKVYCSWYFRFGHFRFGRTAAMKHYREVHAKNDLLCVECNALISMTSQNDLINHYEKKHPTALIPEPTNTAHTASESTDLSAPSNRIGHHTDPNNAQPTIDQPKGKSKRAIRCAKKNRTLRFADVSTNTFFVCVCTNFKFSYLFFT